MGFFIRPNRIRQFAVVMLCYTLIASTFLYYYTHKACYGDRCKRVNLINKDFDVSTRLPNALAGHRRERNEQITKLHDIGANHISDMTTKDLGLIVNFHKINNYKIKKPLKENIDVKTHCKGDSVKETKASYKRTALVSSPGSGNTWTRHLLQQATGIATGSIYGDGLLQRGGFKDEYKCFKANTCLGVKTHEWKQHYPSYFSKGILILRHPRDSVLSSFHYFNGGLHVEEAKPHLLKTDRWVRFAKERIQFWFDLNNDWITKFHNPLYIIFYDKLKADPIEEIEKAVKFLNMTITETDKMCMEKNIQGNFKRNHKTKIDIDTLYDADLTESLNKRVQELTDAINKRFPGMQVALTAS